MKKDDDMMTLRVGPFLNVG